jgi:hypothetical protein
MVENKIERTLDDAKRHVCKQCDSCCVCEKKGDEHIQKCPKCIHYMIGTTVNNIFTY